MWPAMQQKRLWKPTLHRLQQLWRALEIMRTTLNAMPIANVLQSTVTIPPSSEHGDVYMRIIQEPVVFLVPLTMSVIRAYAKAIMILQAVENNLKKAAARLKMAI
jgi:hypothetical protein